MALVTAAEQRAIAARITELERHTDAELVTVLAARSDDYRYIPVLWAALAALAVPSLALFAPWSAGVTVAVQLATFCLLALVFSLPPIQFRLIPRRVREWRASGMARRQFLALGLHATRDATGVLLFVSEAEHYVEIIADRGVHARVPDAAWDAVVGEFVASVRAGATRAGFETALARCEAILAEAVPRSGAPRNELEDRLVLIGYD
ncbi:MAG: hypothetical protein KF911_02955 [Pseudomonadales bacterium]|nr:hypothetical protein [Pseudomonadales bacterium]